MEEDDYRSAGRGLLRYRLDGLPERCAATAKDMLMVYSVMPAAVSTLVSLTVAQGSSLVMSDWLVQWLV